MAAKLTEEDLDFTVESIIYHLGNVSGHLRHAMNGNETTDGIPPRIKARYELEAINYLVAKLKRHANGKEE